MMADVLTFGGDGLRGEFQGLDVLGSDVLQGDGQLLGLSIKQLDRHSAAQFFFGHWLRCVRWAAQRRNIKPVRRGDDPSGRAVKVIFDMTQTV